MPFWGYQEISDEEFATKLADFTQRLQSQQPPMRKRLLTSGQFYSSWLPEEARNLAMEHIYDEPLAALRAKLVSTFIDRLSDDLLVYCASDTSVQVRRLIAERTRLPYGAVEILRNDPDPQIWRSMLAGLTCLGIADKDLEQYVELLRAQRFRDLTEVQRREAIMGAQALRSIREVEKYNSGAYLSQGWKDPVMSELLS